MSNQGGVQAAIRATTGTALDYNGDWHALFDQASIASGPFNGRMLQWINAQLGVSYDSLPGAMQAFAVSQGFNNWSSMDTLTLSGASSRLAGETDGLAIDFTDLSMVIKDTGTPANAFSGDPNSKLTYSSPSTKGIRNSRGLVEYGTTIRTHYGPTLQPIGFRSEKQRTNLLLQSSNFTTTWTNSASSDTSNVATSPDGTLTADKVLADGTAGTAHYITQTGIATIDGVLSVFAKAGEISKILVRGSGASPLGRSFDLSNGTTSAQVGEVAPSAYGIEAYANGWYRCWIYQPGCTAVRLYLLQSFSSVSWDGDSSSGLYLWGAQFEAGTYPTTPIQTTTVTVTRAGDSLLGSVSMFPMSSTENSIVVKYVPFGAPESSATLMEMSATSRFDSLTSITLETATMASFNVQGAAFSGQAFLQPNNVVQSAVNGFATRGKTNDFSASSNGAAVVVDTVGTYMQNAFTLFGIGSTSNGVNNGSFDIVSVKIVPRSMTNAELVTESTP